MSMFDTVLIDDIYCPFCGSDLFDSNFQTKSGDSFLESFSKNEFETKHYQLYEWKGIGQCDKCKEYITLVFNNKSEKHKRYADIKSRLVIRQLKREGTKSHPNHMINIHHKKDGYELFVHNVWCIKCEKLGVDKHCFPPDIDLKYLIECYAKASMDHYKWVTSDLSFELRNYNEE